MIIKNNEEALRVKCEDVQEHEINDLIYQLESELKNSELAGAPGIGLAATQIGIAKKAAIVRVNDFKINLINCNLSKFYDKFIFRQEGCLSFPGRVEDTIRYNEVQIINNLVYPHNFTVTGLLAVVCQHEMEHYNEMLFIDNIFVK